MSKKSKNEPWKNIDYDISQLPIPTQWIVGNILGHGTSGDVYQVTDKKTKRVAAMKVVHLTNDLSTVYFNNEVNYQKAFYPFAPQIFHHDIIFFKHKQFGIIVMELVEHILDSYLITKKTMSELKYVIFELYEILKDLRGSKGKKQSGKTHGDMAFFNCGFIKRGDEMKLILIDFDRSSTDVYIPEVDVLRIYTELYPRYKSKGTKKMHKDNLKLLRDYLPRVMSEFITYMPQNAAEADDIWVNAYEKFCVMANVKCLEDNADNDDNNSNNRTKDKFDSDKGIESKVYDTLSRPELQRLAKNAGISANQKSISIIAQLECILSEDKQKKIPINMKLRHRPI